MITKFKDEALSLVVGLLWTAGAAYFVLYYTGNPLHEFALIRYGQSVTGYITDAWEDAESPDYGGTQWTHAAVYTYRLPDGRQFTAGTQDCPGRLPDEVRDLKQPHPIEVEYLPDNPQVSRIKGSGCQSIFEVLWRKVGLGGLLLACLVSVGLVAVRNAIRNIRRICSGLQPLPYKWPMQDS